MREEHHDLCEVLQSPPRLHDADMCMDRNVRQESGITRCYGKSRRDTPRKRLPERDQKPSCYLNWKPLRMSTIMKAGAFFGSKPRYKKKVLLPDLIIVNSFGSTNLENAARRAGKHLTDSVERKKNVSGLVFHYPSHPSLSLCRRIARLVQMRLPIRAPIRGVRASDRGDRYIAS